MPDIAQLHKKQNRILILVWINFALFMVLFAGIALLTYQSVSLVNRIQGNLDKAEQTVGQLRDRFQQIDPDKAVERLVATATDQIHESIQEIANSPDLTAPLSQLSDKLRTTQATLEKTNQALTDIQAALREIDKGAISPHVLKTKHSRQAANLLPENDGQNIPVPSNTQIRQQ